MVGFLGFGFGGGGAAEVSGNALIIDASGSIPVAVGSTQSIQVACNQTVDALGLTFRVETLAKVDVGSVASESITKSGTTATLQLTAPMTASERTLRWSLVATSTGEAVASGLMFITYDAQGDA